MGLVLRGNKLITGKGINIFYMFNGQQESQYSWKRVSGMGQWWEVRSEKQWGR